ncbi:PIG-L family deacetylase [Erythrobacter insulae]|uniref:PIG-L family deacetylase n=1 Tax=Erythrobacter insulae TaxID=2584124 RepID=A0A547PAI7_9SPHN|nr:PIG-L family deacetylase [Erythrobacter insulae]TRD11156.1 PIG-L family deacetylase [Erythrobacter insulae]
MDKWAIAKTALVAGALLACAPASGHPAGVPRTVLAIVAHPDDELFMAPALASEARQGARVIIVYATSGDAGPGVSGMEKGKALAQMRLKEAYCSAQALGALPVFLQFGDGELAVAAGSEDSTAAKLTKALREQIIDRRPDAILTWGPDGGYGHPDHRMVSALTTQIVQSIDASTRPPLLYSAIAAGRITAAPEIGPWAETAPDLLTVNYSYTDDDLARSVAAAQCHKTQFDDASRAGIMPLFDQAIWKGKISFRSAF